MKRVSKNPKATARRRTALDRLKTQLSTGEKNTNEGVQPLTEKDIARIKGEVAILESRL